MQGSQNYTVRAKLKNNRIDEGVKAQVIAVLRKDGERIDAAASNVAGVAKSKYDEKPTEISADITVPDRSDGEYELSVYLWDGLETMTILAPYKIYKEVAE